MPTLSGAALCAASAAANRWAARLWLATASQWQLSYLPFSIRVVTDRPLRDPQYLPHPARLGSKRGEPKDCAQQLGNLAGTRVWQREADHTKVSIDDDLEPKVCLVDRQEGRVLLAEQDRNCIIFDHATRAQVRDEAHRTAIPTPQGGFQIAAQ